MCELDELQSQYVLSTELRSKRAMNTEQLRIRSYCKSCLAKEPEHIECLPCEFARNELRHLPSPPPLGFVVDGRNTLHRSPWPKAVALYIQNFRAAAQWP